MTQLTWRHGLLCITGLLGNGDEITADFSRSIFSNVSPLFWRVPLFIWAVIVTVCSMTFFWSNTEKYFLYMTHWGLIFIFFESIFGVMVTIKASRGLMPDATFGLPWYVKTYWVLYNISIPVAFLITVFYWGVLKTFSNTVNYAPDPVLDVMLHGVNSLVMFVELIFSAHPSRLLHVMQPLYFAGAYMLFTVIYYFAGGVDPWGNHFVYPVVDWSKPEQTLVVITLTALFLALMHLVTVGLATTRDVIAKRCSRDSAGVYNGGFVP